MQTRAYRVRFLTPAFLGNAEQNGQWRTPPFKHLLREWWRVAWSEANGFDNKHEAMRGEEGSLFGAAADTVGNKSRVRIRLASWNVGTLDRWGNDPKVFHKEVEKGGGKIGAHLYLGYGPLNYKSGTGTYLGKKDDDNCLKPHPAINAGEHVEMRLAFPSQEAPLLNRTLYLINCFGTIGGRSRNGWGSLLLEGVPEAEFPSLRDWEDCLDRDWPHAIGRDDYGPLVWQTGPFDDWGGLMRRLAEIKIGFRTQFRFAGGNNTDRPEKRHWLSYPVTHHSVKLWKNERLPNSLRFKARLDARGKLYGLIFHLPCKPAPQFRPDIRAIKQVWQQVHAYLDGLGDLNRSDLS